MQNKINQQPNFRFLVLFLIATVCLLMLKHRTDGPVIDYTVLLAGNTILLLATIISFSLYKKALNRNGTHAFLRYVYAGMLLKIIICIAAVLIYILIAQNGINRFSLFGCVGLYIVYTFAELRQLMQLSKQKKNV